MVLLLCKREIVLRGHIVVVCMTREDYYIIGLVPLQDLVLREHDLLIIRRRHKAC